MDGLYVIVCIPPSFRLDESKHRNENNGYDWNEIKEMKDYEIVLDKLMDELQQTGNVGASENECDGYESDNDEENDEGPGKMEALNNLAGIFCHIDECISYRELDISGLCRSRTEIINCYDKAKKIIDTETLETTGDWNGEKSYDNKKTDIDL